MSNVVNLNRARKAKARRDKELRAEENRRKFGRTRAEKTLDAKLSDLAARRLDGAHLEATGSSGSQGEEESEGER